MFGIFYWNRSNFSWKSSYVVNLNIWSLSFSNEGLDPLKESDTWIEEDWNIFEEHEFTGSSIPSASAVPTVVLDPLGLIKKGASRRMSEEYISQLCPNGN